MGYARGAAPSHRGRIVAGPGKFGHSSLTSRPRSKCPFNRRESQLDGRALATPLRSHLAMLKHVVIQHSEL